jgi:drug/metabolite transporter (DMT)-like permease
VVPGSSLCIARAPRYLPAAQTGLVLLLEILLGPLFVYMFLGDRPSENDIAGGILVLLTLVAHTLWELRHPRNDSR